MNYSGIKADALWLLAQNKFENNKAFYEQHKEEIKAGITIPMRQIASELATFLYEEVDDKMMLDPVRMVARVRRDTRFTKDKHMYRDNIWTTFMRPKKEWRYYPAMWFEVSQTNFSYGIGTYETPPALMNLYRKNLLARENEFLKAVKSAQSIGATFSGEYYKKPKSGEPSEKLLPYYNVKGLYLIKQRTDFKTLENDEIIKQLQEEFRAFIPMYKFLLSVSDEYISTMKGGNS